jgi:predicted aconitase
MKLTPDEQDILEGKHGRAAAKSMQILFALGTIYGAEHMVPVSSVQIAGVSYDNLGDAGLEFLAEMADGGGKTRVLATLNPAGMDVENWQALGISPTFAEKQALVMQAFQRMGVVTACSCTPYLFGNLPHFGEHIAWAESSAVCFANSVLGARTNREGGPSALASALTGRTPAYGYHLPQERRPTLAVQVRSSLSGTLDFGALGVAIGRRLEERRRPPIPYITGVEQASLEELKSFCASLATFGGSALFHIQGITPEASLYSPPEDAWVVTGDDLKAAAASLNEAGPAEVDFVSLGCPHLSLDEIARLASLLEGRRVSKTFWITTSRLVKHLADRMGYTALIEASGAIFAVDTCCVVAPIKGRFTGLATDSAKACYYAASKNKFKTRFLPFEQVVEEALQ